MTFGRIQGRGNALGELVCLVAAGATGYGAAHLFFESYGPSSYEREVAAEKLAELKSQPEDIRMRPDNLKLGSELASVVSGEHPKGAGIFKGLCALAAVGFYCQVTQRNRIREKYSRDESDEASE